MTNTGKIIVLAYPDTFVTMSDEWICKLLPLVGLGTQKYIKAGHAAQVLIQNATGKAYYYDFGRYGTPKGYGRVRSNVTDAELEIPITAQFDDQGYLLNLQAFLLWLEAHPLKTRGKGRLIASLCECIDFDKAVHYIKGLQQRGSIPYGAFNKNGSNCSRFVADTLLAASSDKKIHKALLFNKLFTPSTVGNVEKAAGCQGIFEVENEVVTSYTGSAFKENITNYFHRKKKDDSTYEAMHSPERDIHTLESIGSTTHFEFLKEELPLFHYRIKRFNEKHTLDFDGVYYSEAFNEKLPFRISHDSHCGHCHILQDDQIIKLVCIASYASFSKIQKGIAARIA